MVHCHTMVYYTMVAIPLSSLCLCLLPCDFVVLSLKIANLLSQRLFWSCPWDLLQATGCSSRTVCSFLTKASSGMNSFRLQPATTMGAGHASMLEDERHAEQSRLIQSPQPRLSSDRQPNPRPRRETSRQKLTSQGQPERPTHRLRS